MKRDEITAQKPVKGLLEPLRKTGGRNSQGKISVRHIGGGHKRQYRLIDFRRDKTGIPARVASVEYDPNRSARIALLHYKDGEKRYILHPIGLVVGSTVISGPEADILVGNAMPLKNIPVGTTIHNIELRPGKGAQMVRSAGGLGAVGFKGRRGFCACQAAFGRDAASGGRVHGHHRAGGQYGSRKHHDRKSRADALDGSTLPTVRGVAMNPVDHPHGGGEEDFRRAPSGYSVGATHPWIQDPKKQTHRSIYCVAQEEALR